MGNEVAKYEKSAKINNNTKYPNHIFDLKTFQPVDLRMMNVFLKSKLKYMFHSTKPCNALEIINKGFKLEKMKEISKLNFGKGIFLTRNFSYATGYGRFIFVCLVDLGEIYHTNQYFNEESDFPPHDTIHYTDSLENTSPYNKGGRLYELSKEFDFFANPVTGDEYCVRNPERIELLYLIELAPFDYVQKDIWGVHECALDFKNNYNIDENTFYWSVDFSELFYFKYMKKIEACENGLFLYKLPINLRIVTEKKLLHSDLIMFGHIYSNNLQITLKNYNLFNFINKYENFFELEKNNEIYLDIFGIFGEKPTYIFEEDRKISAFAEGGSFYEGSFESLVKRQTY